MQAQQNGPELLPAFTEGEQLVFAILSFALAFGWAGVRMAIYYKTNGEKKGGIMGTLTIVIFLLLGAYALGAHQVLDPLVARLIPLFQEALAP